MFKFCLDLTQDCYFKREKEVKLRDIQNDSETATSES